MGTVGTGVDGANRGLAAVGNGRLVHPCAGVSAPRGLGARKTKGQATSPSSTTRKPAALSTPASAPGSDNAPGCGGVAPGGGGGISGASAGITALKNSHFSGGPQAVTTTRPPRWLTQTSSRMACLRSVRTALGTFPSKHARKIMHQQPDSLPVLSKSPSRSVQRSGVTGCISIIHTLSNHVYGKPFSIVSIFRRGRWRWRATTPGCPTGCLQANVSGL
jgi:hypothetical protein